MNGLSFAKTLIGSIGACSLICGCAAVNAAHDYARARQTIMDATGSSSVFEPEEAGAVTAAVSERIADGITTDEAVEICLLNNPSLQAAFLNVGIARADLVQSGLLSNPTLALSIAFPEGGGRSNIQATLAQSIVDLWQIPVRKRQAARSLDAAILDLARQAAQIAIDTKAAHYSAVAADQTLVIARENLQLAEQLLEAAQARQRAGAVGELDVNLVRGTLYSAELETQRARLESSTARRRLAILLGLTDVAQTLVLTTPISIETPTPLDAERITDLALASRLDVQASRQEIEANRARVDLEYRKIFPDISIGAYLERNERRALPGRNIAADTARASVAAGQLTAPEIQSRGQREQERSQEIDSIFGPAFNLTLPIFDQNQAQIAKARFSYEQALKQLEAIERSVIQQVRQGVDQAETARSVAEYFRGKLLPQAQSNLDLSRESYAAGRASLIVLLDAQRVLLATRRDAIAAERDRATALAELELVVSKPISAILTLQTTSAPSDASPANKMEETNVSP
ncbi:MAG: TolC family protein [Planctomycetes bacterium]|nr:TolC family protein [Planctomycetota bacterium]